MPAITATEPFKMDILRDVLSRWVAPALNHVVEVQFVRAILHDDTTYLVAVDDALNINTLAMIKEHSPSSLPSECIGQLAHLLGCDADIQAFYAYCASDKHLSELIAPLKGIPLWRTVNIFEALIFTIIEQHINWQAAQKAQAAFVQIIGNEISYQGQSYYAMPTPEQVAQFDEDTLKPIKITHGRIRLILDIARKMVTGELDFHSYEQEDDAEGLYQALLTIKGVGHWTAANTVNRFFGRYSYILHNDVALQAAVGFYFHNMDKRIDAKTLQATLAQYGDYAGLVAHFTLLRWVLDRYPVQLRKRG
jgi:DNA-3-methyladenine glycosylase II